MADEPNTAVEEIPEATPDGSDFTEFKVNRVAEERGEAPPTAKPKDEHADAGESEADTGDHEPESSDEPEDKKTRKGGFQRKIEARDREIEELKAKLAQAEKAKPAVGEPEVNKNAEPAESVGEKPAKPKRPNPENFQTDQDYDKAEEKYLADSETYLERLATWTTKKALADAQVKAEAEARKKSEATAAQKIWDSHVERTAEFSKKHADYGEVIEQSKTKITIPPYLAEPLFSSEYSADLCYHLAKNPDVATALIAKNPLDAAVELGRLEARLSSNGAGPASGYTPPPDPIRTGAPGGEPPTDLTHETDFSRYAAGRKHQESRRLGR